MTPQLVLDVTLDMPPKPKARLTPMLQSAGKPCRACGKRAKMWAASRPDSDHGHPEWVALAQSKVAMAWWGNKPLNGPLRVTLAFVLPRPKTRPNVPKVVVRDGFKVPNPRYQTDFIVSAEDWKRGERVWCPRTPDLDRLTNAVFDVCTKCAVWWDDSQAVTWGRGTGKWYAAVGEEPSIRLRVEAA